MSGLEVAAGIIGIADVTLKSIKGLYDVFQAYQEVPAELERFHKEITGLQSNLGGLAYLETADEATREEVRKLGLDKHMESCAASCEEFKRKLEKWTRHGPSSFRDKARILVNASNIQKYTTRMWTTARMLDSAIGILTLKKTTNIESLTKQIDQWRIEAQNEKDQNAERMVAVDDDDDAETALEEKDDILAGFLSQTHDLGTQLEKIKLNQTIKNVNTHEEAQVQVGMPESAADKVANMDIQDITTGRKAKAQIGIFGSGKGVFD
ncbi:unnamed protein product [Periconia digitata]|uniref:Azaphilone pigments biosynthesis cluster protein L N-terminal domain-containing protein n=1 Tax=Periconia digitata TaxID=1303443 RepID=A0A9W4UL55_9PLEO|nr:unnamed protein product [Periconia digitata]